MPNWNYVLREIQKEPNDPSGGESASDKIRKKYLQQLHDHTGRNIICYYSGWLSKPNVEGSEINDEDKNGLMLCIHGMDRKKGLDLFLHTPGGNGAATESLVHYIRQMFGDDVRAFVPQLAMSAGTIIACSCKEIYMGKHSNLGPVDPQINGIPAYAVTEEIERAYNEIKADPDKAMIWQLMMQRITPGFVQQCHWAIEAGREMVAKFLRANMLSHLPDGQRETVTEEIAHKLSKIAGRKGHDNHLHADECKSIGLVIKDLEDPADKKLQDLVLTVHHCFIYTLSNTPAFKIIENHVGRRYVKIVQTMLMPMPMPMTPPPDGPPGGAVAH